MIVLFSLIFIYDFQANDGFIQPNGCLRLRFAVRASQLPQQCQDQQCYIRYLETCQREV